MLAILYPCKIERKGAREKGKKKEREGICKRTFTIFCVLPKGKAVLKK